MSKTSFFLGPVLVLVLGGTAASQSLADVARAEEARRKAVKAPGKVYTNDTLRGIDGGDPPAPPPAPAASAPDAGAAPAATPSEPPAPTADDRSKDEKHWRDRITAARSELQRSEAFLGALQSQVQSLYTEFVATDDPAQRALVEKRRLAALAELDRVKGEVGRLTKAIADIEDEARRANVPAGWLR